MTLNELQKLSDAASPGAWFADSENGDGSYGAGEDTHEGFHVATISFERTPGKYEKLFDSLNSDAGCVHEEYGDEYGGCYAWDEVARANAEFVVAAVNYVRALLREKGGEG